MRFEELNESNYLLFAIKFYNNPQAVTKDDFEDDLKRIKYIKRLLKRYKNTGELKTHLILNHLTVLFNVFNEFIISFSVFSSNELVDSSKTNISQLLYKALAIPILCF